MSMCAHIASAASTTTHRHGVHTSKVIAGASAISKRGRPGGSDDQHYQLIRTTTMQATRAGGEAKKHRNREKA